VTLRVTVTKSLCESPGPLCARNAWASIVIAMDVVAIALGIVMFLVLLALIEGIDRV